MSCSFVSPTADLVLSSKFRSLPIRLFACITLVLAALFDQHYLHLLHPGFLPYIAALEGTHYARTRDVCPSSQRHERFVHGAEAPIYNSHKISEYWCESAEVWLVLTEII